MRSRLFVLLASALVLGHGTRAVAATSSDGFGVSLTMGTTPPPTVTIIADDLSFGTSTGESKFATSLIRVTAPSGLAYTIYLDGGLHLQAPTGGQAFRALASGTNLIPYLLAADGFGTPWGDGTTPGLGTGVTSSGSGAQQTFTVYGGAQPTITGQPPAPNGSYTDFVTATVNF